MEFNAAWLETAVSIIKTGTADRLDKDGVTVYRVKDIIRVDIKTKNGG